MGAPGTYPFLPDEKGLPLSVLEPNPAAMDDPTQWFSPEMPEWNMEKYRFYLDLPGAASGRPWAGAARCWCPCAGSG